MASSLKTQRNNSDDGDTIERTRNRLLAKVQTIEYYEKFNPRDYETYWTRLEHPIEYLESIGIEKVSELTQHGFSPNEIAKLLGLSSFIFNRWLRSSPEYLEELSYAKKYLGNERAYQALRELENAPETLEGINRAKAISNIYMAHAQSQARDEWGKQVQVDQKITSAMTFNIDLGQAVKNVPPPIEGVSSKKSKVDNSASQSDLLFNLTLPESDQ